MERHERFGEFAPLLNRDGTFAKSKRRCRQGGLARRRGTRLVRRAAASSSCTRVDPVQGVLHRVVSGTSTLAIARRPSVSGVLPTLSAPRRRTEIVLGVLIHFLTRELCRVDRYLRLGPGHAVPADRSLPPNPAH